MGLSATEGAETGGSNQHGGVGLTDFRVGSVGSILTGGKTRRFPGRGNRIFHARNLFENDIGALSGARKPGIVTPFENTSWS